MHVFSPRGETLLVYDKVWSARRYEAPKLVEIDGVPCTLARQLKADRELVKAYMGHAPGDIFGAHYRRVDPEELRAVSALMESWRETAEAEGIRKHSGNISAEEAVKD